MFFFRTIGPKHERAVCGKLFLCSFFFKKFQVCCRPQQLYCRFQRSNSEVSREFLDRDMRSVLSERILNPGKWRGGLESGCSKRGLSRAKVGLIVTDFALCILSAPTCCQLFRPAHTFAHFFSSRSSRCQKVKRRFFLPPLLRGKILHMCLRFSLHWSFKRLSRTSRLMCSRSWFQPLGPREEKVLCGWRSLRSLVLSELFKAFQVRCCPQQLHCGSTPHGRTIFSFSGTIPKSGSSTPHGTSIFVFCWSASETKELRGNEALQSFYSKR